MKKNFTKLVRSGIAVGSLLVIAASFLFLFSFFIKPTGALASWSNSRLAITALCDPADPSCVGGPPPPIPKPVTMTASPATFISGGTSNITWSATWANECFGSSLPVDPLWPGMPPVTGSQMTSALFTPGTYIYSLDCDNTTNNYAGSKSVSITVTAPPAPVLSMTGSSATISAGNTVTLSWNTQYATSCTASGDWTGPKPATDGAHSEVVGPLPAFPDPYIFNLSCSGISGKTKATFSVQVNSTLNGAGGSGGNITGFAWSENVGWISFNSASDNSQYNYGVNENTTTGALSGYAWSDNVGWLSFNAADVVGCPTAPCAPTVLPSGALSGWAKALSAGDGWDGWVALSGTNINASLNTSTGAFSGYLWGGNDGFGYAGVLGWLNMAPDNGFGGVFGPKTATGSLSAPNCTILSGQSTCSTPFTWSIMGGVSPNLYNETTVTQYLPNPLVGASGVTPNIIAYGLNTVRLKDGNTVVATATPSGVCDVGTSWDPVGKKCVPAPTVSISVSPSSIYPGSSATISWMPANADACSASGDWQTLGAKTSATGTWSESTGTKTVSGTYSYTITCTNNAGGSASATAWLTVRNPTASISASPNPVGAGAPLNVTWSSSPSISGCTASSSPAPVDALWNGAKGSGGTQAVTPITVARTYNVQCTDVYGNATPIVSAPVTVSVVVCAVGVCPPGGTPLSCPQGCKGTVKQF